MAPVLCLLAAGRRAWAWRERRSLLLSWTLLDFVFTPQPPPKRAARWVSLVLPAAALMAGRAVWGHGGGGAYTDDDDDDDACFEDETHGDSDDEGTTSVFGLGGLLESIGTEATRAVRSSSARRTPSGSVSP